MPERCGNGEQAVSRSHGPTHLHWQPAGANVGMDGQSAEKRVRHSAAFRDLAAHDLHLAATCVCIVLARV